MLGQSTTQQKKLQKKREKMVLRLTLPLKSYPENYIVKILLMIEKFDGN